MTTHCGHNDRHIVTSGEGTSFCKACERGWPADPIRVWRFDLAPDALAALSNHGGDEDWLALVPRHMVGEYIPWLEFGTFGVCDITEHFVKDGDELLGVVYIGAHA